MGEEADAKGGQPWRFDIRIVSLDDLPQDVEGVAVLWAKGEVRKSTPVCAATAGRAVFETPPALGLETVLKLNDETNTFDDKFLRFSVKKAVDQRLSALGQFLIKVSRFATTPNVQSEVKRVPLSIGNDKGKATVSYTVTCFPASDDVSSQSAASVVSTPASPPPDVAAPVSKPSAGPPAPSMPREEFLAATSLLKSDNSAAPVSPTAYPSSASASSDQIAPSSDLAAIRPTAPIPKPSLPKPAVKISDSQDSMDVPHSQLRRVDVTAHDLHALKVDDIRNFDRDSLLQLSAVLLSRQHSSTGAARSSSATESSANVSSSESARLQATVEILKGRLAAEASVGLGYDSVSYLQTELISAMVRIAELECDNAELKFVASRSQFEVAEIAARAASHRGHDVVSKQQLSEIDQRHAASATKAVVSFGPGTAVGGSPVVTKEQQQPAKIEIANDEEDVRAYAKYLGLDPDVDKALMWIAVEGLSAPLPDNWSEHVDENGNLFYWNKEQSTSQWDHPCDDIYKAFVKDAKKEMSKKGSKAKSYLTRPDPMKK